MKQKIPFLLILFSALFTYGQVTLAVTDVKDPKVNQQFNLTVILEISGENMEQETPLRMPDLSKFEIIGSASEQNTVLLDSKKGDVLNQMVYQWVLLPKQVGKVKFGSVLVTVNGKIYKTEPFEINVREGEKKSTVAENSAKQNEVYLNLSLEEKSVYKNEPVIAILRAFSKDYGNFRKVSNIHFSRQKNMSIKPLSFAKSEIESKGGMASQIIGKFLIFPDESGKLEINSISAIVSNADKQKKISSNKVQFNVKKLPAGMPQNFNNAVGKFDVTVAHQNNAEIPEVEKPVNIRVRVSGVGNFGDFQLPKIVNSSNYTSFTPQITTNTTTKQDELSGQIIAEYVVIPKKSGPISIDFENFSYFNPVDKNYTDLGAKSIQLNVKTHDEVVDGKSTLEKVNDYTNIVLETVNTPVLQTQNLKIKDRNSMNWKIILGNLGLVFAVFSLFLVIRKKNTDGKKKSVLVDSSIGSIAEKEAIIRTSKVHHLDENIEYLKKLNKNKDFEKFFSAYQDLNEDVKNYFSTETESDFKKYLETNKGSQATEQYRVLSEKIQIEKYMPFHTEEHLDSLLESIIKFYTDIIK